MSTLSQNISQAIEDFDSIKDAIVQQKVEVPVGTPTSEYSEKILEISGKQPTGSIEIAENGTYNISDFAEANVNVPLPQGSIDITENGEDIDIYSYATANVNVPQGIFPEGTIEIVRNGRYEISTYANLDVGIPDTAYLAKLIDGTLTEIVIPEGCTKITTALRDCENLTECILPSTVREFDQFAFNGLPNLRTVTIPEGVTELSFCLFNNCSNLQFPVLPSTLIKLNAQAFGSCTSIVNITLPENLEQILNWCFSGCTNLESVKFTGNRLIQVDNGVFKGCQKLKAVYCPSVADWVKINFWYEIEVTSNPISNENKNTPPGLYVDSSLVTSINLSDGTTYIGTTCFCNYHYLESATIGGSILEIRDRAFCRCYNLQTVVIGDSVTSIGDYAFDGCSALQELTIGNNITTIGLYAFYDCTSLIEVYTGQNLQILSEGAFSNCSNLTTVHFPRTLTTVQAYAFQNCNNLSTIYFEGTWSEWEQVEIADNNDELRQATVICSG